MLYVLLHHIRFCDLDFCCVELVFYIWVFTMLCVNTNLSSLLLCSDFLFVEMVKEFGEKKRMNGGG